MRIFTFLPIHIQDVLEKRIQITDDKLNSFLERDCDEKSYELKICALDGHESVKRCY